jgi:pimeloyl-ACP methyl ester carboxylesterase
MDRLAQYVGTSLFDDPEYQRITYERMRRNDLGAIRRTMIALLRFNLLGQLDRIQAPTLVLTGDRDKTVPRRCAYEMATRIPCARFRTISDAGHALPYDQPEAFLAATLDFLEQS